VTPGTDYRVALAIFAGAFVSTLLAEGPPGCVVSATRDIFEIKFRIDEPPPPRVRGEIPPPRRAAHYWLDFRELVDHGALVEYGISQARDLVRQMRAVP
jgi:hypothetical protein